MSMYAFKDEERKIKVLARDAYRENKAVRLYCPNKKCDAHMYICSREGSSSFYFRASSTYGHIENCRYGVGNGFNPEKFNEATFDFTQALSNLTTTSTPQTKKLHPGTHKEGDSTLKPPHTIRQIYDMCTQHHYLDTYNDIVIGKMLLYDESIDLYPNDTDVTGWRLIEATRCKPKFYKPGETNIYLVTSLYKKKYHFVLKFNDGNLYTTMQKEIFGNKDNKNLKIIVAGEWSHFTTENRNVENKFTATILSKKQFKIMI
ncbi:hypothetical protein PTI45_04651 [Paenibacillus nuruki]|uniref:Uncharacterized protein n=1 Tax=Paenibacillus nuruki TaxID=1886670 RepID=A0A1E3KYN3_9BACL|nr:hypothetical protein [Paenibacillus nuruki]ODP26015.1 hypothetical protein PTI45_04651 [Paenibacillus nuruki]